MAKATKKKPAKKSAPPVRGGKAYAAKTAAEMKAYRDSLPKTLWGIWRGGWWAMDLNSADLTIAAYSSEEAAKSAGKLRGDKVKLFDPKSVGITPYRIVDRPDLYDPDDEEEDDDD